jgi:type IV fimbrial biogenesis protein FimT
MRKKTIRSRSYRTKWIIRTYKNNSFELGFSLVELLFTIVISSILLTLAFPVFKHLIVELRLFILTERISSTLDYARSEAIRRQHTVTICKSKDGKACSGSWNDGWIVLVSNSPLSLENATLLRVYSALSRGESLEWHGFRSDNYLQWHPDGSSSQNGRFIICIHSLSEKMIWFVKISQTGRGRIDKKNSKNADCNN